MRSSALLLESSDDELFMRVDDLELSSLELLELLELLGLLLEEALELLLLDALELLELVLELDLEPPPELELPLEPLPLEPPRAMTGVTARPKAIKQTVHNKVFLKVNMVFLLNK